MQFSGGTKQTLNPETFVDEGSLGKQQNSDSADIQHSENQGENLNVDDEGWILLTKREVKGEK